MIKFSSIYLLSAVMVLSSCASVQNLRSSDDALYSEKHDNDSGSSHADYGAPTRQEDMKVEQRELTPDIVSALNVPDAVSVLAFDLNGNPIQFTIRNDKLTTQNIVYPLETSQIGNVYTTTYVWFEGSHCVDIADILGNRMRICS